MSAPEARTARGAHGGNSSDPVRLPLSPEGGTGSVYVNTSRRSLNALRRVAQAVAGSTGSPARTSGHGRTGHPH